MLNEKQRTNFFQKVKKQENGCWLWTASVSTSGYGRMRVAGVTIAAHRIAYRQHCGPIPEGMCVCHKCDVRTCVNPEHLFVGTHQDNMNDMTAKGRHRCPDRKGVNNGHARLTEDHVREISVLLPRLNNRQIAAKFGVTGSMISLIRRGKSWTHVTSIKPDDHVKYVSLMNKGSCSSTVEH